MRLLSLLITLGIVAWLVYTQIGSGGAGQAEAKAATVQIQVDDQFARQAGQLSRMEQGEPAGQ